MTVTRLIARPMLASMFFVGAANALKNTSGTAVRARNVTDAVVPRLQAVSPVPIPDDPETLVRINAAAQIVAAAGLATGRAPRLSAAVLAASLLPTTAAGHPFWKESDAGQRANQRVHFFKNVSMLGGLLIAAADTDGKPGVAWRARRAAKDVRREARVLAKQARQEARIAKAQLT